MFQRHIYSHYFFSGLTVATGVIGLGAVCYILFGPAVAAGVSLGASCVSINDVPTPKQHKVFEILAALALTTLVQFLIGISRTGPWMEGLAILGITFFASMITMYGKKTLPLSFSMIFSMIMGMGVPAHGWEVALHQTRLFAIGGGLYAVYSLIVAGFLQYRTRQQALGELLQSLAGYLRRQADCYDPQIPMDEGYRAVIEQKAVVADRLQVARDLVFRSMRTSRDGMLAATLSELLELFELMLSSQTDYGILREYFADSELLTFYRDLALKAGQDLENIGLRLMRGRVPRGTVSCKAELIAMEYSLNTFAAFAGGDAAKQQALRAAMGSRDKLLACLRQIDVIRRASRTPVSPEKALQDAVVRPFLSRARFSPLAILGHISLRSQVLRYAIRLSLAMGCGYLVALFLPYASRGYWILLTVAVVMRSSYSQTRQRHWDRVVGNILGCLFTAILLWATPNQVVLAAVAFLSMVITHSFVVVNYRYSATAACVMGLLFIHFLTPGSRFVALERIMDTVIGAALAWGFSFILPNWEASGIPRLTNEVMAASGAYAQETLFPWHDLMRYRLARKRLIDAIAALGMSISRMVGEPESQRRSLAPLNSFINASYLMAAQLASLHGLLALRREDLDAESLTAMTRRTADQVVKRLQGEEGGLPALEIAHPESSPMDQIRARLVQVELAAQRLGEVSRQV
ncbi:FUSC family protein [Holophaga foetida]|uniref:FUSC family protein n=1 Tax=Holophaga foetida TaxID=35839 RepID=UPI0002471C62|nr:FUSC family membrane protein [Holophaga foetida]